MLKKEQLPEVIHTKLLARLDILLIALSVNVDTPKSVNDIKTLVRDSGFTEVHKWNISAILKHSKGLAIRLKEGWSLTSSGRKHVIDTVDIISKKSKKVIHHSDQLRIAVKKITNSNTKEFLEEAIVAYETGLYRSSVVLSWAGAISLLYDVVINKSLNIFNNEAKRRDPKWRPAVIKDDLCRMKESEFLDIIGSPPVSIIGKNLKEELKNQCLQLRNSCGHPNSLKIGENKTSAHLEVLILNIFTKFN